MKTKIMVMLFAVIMLFSCSSDSNNSGDGDGGGSSSVLVKKIRTTWDNKFLNSCTVVVGNGGGSTTTTYYADIDAVVNYQYDGKKIVQIDKYVSYSNYYPHSPNNDPCNPNNNFLSGHSV